MMSITNDYIFVVKCIFFLNQIQQFNKYILRLGTLLMGWNAAVWHLTQPVEHCETVH